MIFEDTDLSFSTECAGQLFRARAVSESVAEKAFTLVQLAWPDVTLDEWKDMIAACRLDSRRRSAWVVIEDTRSYFHAIFFCRLRLSRKFGSILRISEMITAELPGPAIVQTAIDFAAHLAVTNRIRAVEFDLEDDQVKLLTPRLAVHLEGNGWMFDVRNVLRFQPIIH